MKNTKAAADLKAHKAAIKSAQKTAREITQYLAWLAKNEMVEVGPALIDSQRESLALYVSDLGFKVAEVRNSLQQRQAAATNAMFPQYAERA